jgi:hypothetical protein
LPPGLEKRRRLGAIRQHGTRAVNHPMRGEEKGGKCTCWVIMRGDTARPDGWESAEYELAPNPSCPVHGRKLHPLLEDEEVSSAPVFRVAREKSPRTKHSSEDGEGSADGEAPGRRGDPPAEGPYRPTMPEPGRMCFKPRRTQARCRLPGIPPGRVPASVIA